MVPPQNVSELKSFLGICNYYRRYVKDLPRLAAPLNRLLQTGVAWRWAGDPEHKAFELLKQKLIEAPVLRRPDFSRPFELHTDWSSTGLGAVLAQRDEDGKEYVVTCTRHAATTARSETTPVTMESALAAVWAVCYFRVSTIMGGRSH